MTGSFLAEPTMSAQAQELYDEDLAESGYVWNVSGCGRTSPTP
jgi:hypothetical protein